MKLNKFYFNRILVVTLITLLLAGCSSTDDSTDSEPVLERTKITMEPTGNVDVDWETATMVWNEEFNETTVLDDIWVFESKNTTNPDVADQLQVYRKENVSLSGGTMKITAKKKAAVYTSARINSKYAFKYGRIEIGAKLPEQEKNGIWAKLVLIGDNEATVGWPQCGEIDIMEYFSHKANEFNNNIHSAANNAFDGSLISANHNLETVEEEFHAYGILWTDRYIKFYVDDPGNILYTFNRPSSPNDNNWPFDKPFYLLVDMVVGGKYIGDNGVDDTLFPAVMEIDYIRVYHIQ